MRHTCSVINEIFTRVVSKCAFSISKSFEMRKMEKGERLKKNDFFFF